MMWRKTRSQFTLPVLLAVLNVLLLGALLIVLQPIIDDLQVQRDQRRGQVRQLQAQVRDAETELEMLADSRATFEQLLADGLLASQDRLAAARTLERLRGEHRLTSIQYEMEPERTLPQVVPAGADVTVVSTTISVSMKGLLDTDLVSFAQAVARELPGQVRIQALHLERGLRPQEESLAALRSGQLVSFVVGSAEFEWRTLRFPVQAAEERGS
jgi:competence protein ComGC